MDVNENVQMQATELQTELKSGRVRSGRARMDKLSPEERSTLARQAAEARWDAERALQSQADRIYKASHTGELKLGDSLIVSCAVVDDGIRVISRNAVFRAFGRTKRGRARSETRVPNMPSFIDAKNLQPFVSKYIDGGLKQIVYKDLKSRINAGYNALLLPQLCDVYLEARLQKVLTRRQEGLAMAAEILARSLSKVGIIALVDEATGYQEVRDKRALEQILATYIGKELAKWAKRFPDEFYQQMFRLKGWKYDPSSSKRPYRMAHITVDVVYDRIGPGLTDELRRKKQEEKERGGRDHKLHQWLTETIGHPALAHHLSGVTFLGKAFNDGDWDLFHDALDRIAPRYNRTMLLPFEGVTETPIGVPTVLSLLSEQSQTAS